MSGFDVVAEAGGLEGGGRGGGIAGTGGGGVAGGGEAVGLEGRLRGADIVVTGEGSFDGQSGQGKTVGRVRQLAEEAGVPCVVMAGRAEGAAGEVRTLADIEPEREASMRNAARLLEELAGRWAGSVAV